MNTKAPISVKYFMEPDSKRETKVTQTIGATLTEECSLLWKILRVESSRVLAQILPGADKHMSVAK